MRIYRLRDPKRRPIDIIDLQRNVQIRPTGAYPDTIFPPTQTIAASNESFGMKHTNAIGSGLGKEESYVSTRKAKTRKNAMSLNLCPRL